jgi:3-oxoacyl-[acyl-carrier protein] reductase
MSTDPKRYALVTGGSRGIGRATCLALAKEGWHLLVNYVRDAAAADGTAEQVRALGVECETLQFDVRDKEAVDAALTAWYAAHPNDRIEVLVNNSGVTRDNLFVFLKQEEWRDVIDTSLNGFFNVTNFIIQKMVRNRSGRIVNVVSVSGLKGVPGQTNYSAAKAGMIGATRSLAVEVAKRKITVNAVAPGFIKTDMTAGLPEEELRKLIPMERFGNVEEVADVITFLVSPKASYITGEVININGGIHS